METFSGADSRTCGESHTSCPWGAPVAVLKSLLRQTLRRSPKSTFHVQKGEISGRSRSKKHPRSTAKAAGPASDESDFSDWARKRAICSQGGPRNLFRFGPTPAMCGNVPGSLCVIAKRKATIGDSNSMPHPYHRSMRNWATNWLSVCAWAPSSSLLDASSSLPDAFASATWAMA